MPRGCHVDPGTGIGSSISRAVPVVGAILLVLLACFGLYRCNMARYESEARRPSYKQRMGPAASSASGYSTGYSLGHMMGLQGAGSPTDEALRSMSATHAAGDELQFRIGYRNGLLAGQQERASR